MPGWLLVTRANCPLCDAMAAAVRQRLGGVPLAEAYVDADPELKRRYDWEVPVLFADDVEVCRHAFDGAAFDAALERLGAA
jgi:hypothetical protein